MLGSFDFAELGAEHPVPLVLECLGGLTENFLLSKILMNYQWVFRLLEDLSTRFQFYQQENLLKIAEVFNELSY